MVYAQLQFLIKASKKCHLLCKTLLGVQSQNIMSDTHI